jgi:6-phosphogluconolactonase (cycloisomerase 2 family)
MGIKARVLGVLAALITMSLSGCGHYTCGTTFGSSTCSSSGGGISQGGNPTGGLVAFGYFADFSRNGLPSTGMALQQLDLTTGSFTSITAFAPPVVPPFPTGITIVNKKYAYVSSSDGNVYGFAIDGTTGFFTSTPNSPYIVAGGNSIASNAEGTLVFVGDTGGQQITSFTINADGSLTTVGTYATTGVNPVVMTTDGLSKYVYATAGKGSTAVAEFTIGSGGALTAVTGSPVASNISSIASEPSGKFLFGVSYQAGDNNVQVYSISSTGSLALVSTVATSSTPRNVVVHPNGTWVYTMSEDPILPAEEPVEGFTFNNTSGVLTEMSDSPFTDIIANGGVIEQSGQFLFGLGITVQATGGTSTVTPYLIDSSSGSLSSWPPGVDSSQGFAPGIDGAAYAATDAP